MNVMPARTLLLGCVLLTAPAALGEFETRLRPGEQLERQFGVTAVRLGHTPARAESALPSVQVSFDRDIRVAGNDLAAGSYSVTLQPMAEDDIHVVFATSAGEQLRLSVRPDNGPRTTTPFVELRVEEPEQRHRRRPRDPRIEIDFRWEARRITAPIRLTGLLWRSTPPPPVPAELREAWAIVESSLRGFVNQSMDQHVKHFADDFESDWDDGGSQEAHMQMIGRMLYEGEFEDTVLQLDGAEWEKSEGRVTFRGLVVQAPFGASPLVYTVEQRDGHWEIVHLDGPKQN